MRATPGFERIVQRGLDHALALLALPGRRFRVDIHVTCGGGRHRSVVVAEELAARLQEARQHDALVPPSSAPRPSGLRSGWAEPSEALLLLVRV
ncbi:RapZ C-terminal domain-containing protein [Streptomyces microflavus]|uniref:RapZ C-terminal domain-containing protein n=1 Tax=Streptomyces microflavus TaxID=1919 RepID=UPI003663D1AA